MSARTQAKPRLRSTCVSALRNPTPRSGPRWALSALSDSRASGLWFKNLLHCFVGFRRSRNLRKFLALDDHLDLVGVEHFAFEQCQGNLHQGLVILRQNVLGPHVAFADDAP